MHQQQTKGKSQMWLEFGQDYKARYLFVYIIKLFWFSSHSRK